MTYIKELKTQQDKNSEGYDDVVVIGRGVASTGGTKPIKKLNL